MINKITVPTILVVTIMIAGIFAFVPIEQVSTVHNSLTDDIADLTNSISIENLFADIGSAESDNSDLIIVDFVVLENSGDAVVGLSAGDFDTDFIAGADPVDVTILIDASGSGGYGLTIEPTNNWDTGRTDIVLSVATEDVSAITLVVAELE